MSSDAENRGPVPVKLIVPDSVLRQLRMRRDVQRRHRTPNPSLAYLSTVELARSGATGEDATILAEAFVGGMNDLQAQVEAQYDAFLLDPGMGPMTYLSADGRIINDNRTWDGCDLEIETSLDRAIVALVAGAKKTGILELLSLIPPLENGRACPRCSGERWATVSDDLKFVCTVCFGRGEVDDRLLRLAHDTRAG